MLTKTAILNMLDLFARQRTGMNPRDYISHSRDTDGRRAYRSTAREITQDLNDARELMRVVQMTPRIDVPELKDAFRSKRLTLTETDGKGWTLDYCTGQYFATEYRKAVCAVLRSALWTQYMNDLPSIGEGSRAAIIAEAKRNLSAPVWRRWFKEA